MAGLYFGTWYLGAAGLKYEPRIPSDIWKVALGGLFVSADLALLFMVVPIPYEYAVTGVWINGMILLLNLLPISIMDGGQILRGLRMERSK